MTICNLEEAEKNLIDLTVCWEASFHLLAIDRNLTLTKEADVNKVLDTTDIAELTSKSLVFLLLTLGSKSLLSF